MQSKQQDVDAVRASALATSRATSEQFAVFQCGLDAVLQQWTALHLVCANARDEGAATTLRSELLAWFRDDGEVYPDELLEYFEDFFQSGNFFVSIEDGSPQEVSEAIHAMYLQCCRNDDQLVRGFQQSLEHWRAANPVAQSVFGGNVGFGGEIDMSPDADAVGDGATLEGAEGSSDGDDDGEETGEVPQPPPAFGHGVLPTSVPLMAPQPKPAQQGRHQQERGSNRHKNNFTKGADGWCTVGRK